MSEQILDSVEIVEYEKEIVPSFIRVSAHDVRERTETSSLQETIKLPRISRNS